jgi:sec-independent protein translocase protein TatB
MFDGVGWGEIVVLILIGLFVFGPDRLPKAARDAGRLLRQLRQMATGVREDLRAELGPDFADLDLRTLHPKAFVRKHLLEEDDDPLFKPYLGGKGAFDRALFGDLGEPLTLTKDRASQASQALPGASLTKDRNVRSSGLAKASLVKSSGQSVATTSDGVPVPSWADSAGPSASDATATPYDLDAT